MVLECQIFFYIGLMGQLLNSSSTPGVTSHKLEFKKSLEAFARFLKHRPSAQFLFSMSHQNWLLQLHLILTQITVSSV